MNELQEKILEIAQYFDSLCESNQIKYFMMGGSALGAIRHKGFIPWDDDYDVFVSYDNYLKLLSVVDDENKFNKEKYCFQRRNTDENLPFIDKLRLRNTLFIEENSAFNPNKCNGIYIDIMLLIKSPNNIFKRVKQFIYAKMLVANQLSKNGYKTNSFLKNKWIKFSTAKIAKRGQKPYLDYIFSFESDTKFNKYCHIFGRAGFFQSYYSKEIFDEQLYVQFENCLLPVMSGYDEYLKKRYGKNYMSPPSEKTINSFPKHNIYYNCSSDLDERPK